jgi:hypothetical protein
MAYKGVMNTTPDRKRRIGLPRYRLAADGIQEVKRAMDKKTEHLVDDLEMQWEGAEPGARRTLMTAHLLNGIFTWFLGLPDADQDDILLHGIAAYIRRLEGDPKAPFESIPVRSAKARGIGGRISDSDQPPKPKRKDLGPET